MHLQLLLKYWNFCLPHSNKFVLVIQLQNKTKKEERHYLSTVCSEYSPNQPHFMCLELGSPKGSKQNVGWGVLLHIPD